MHEYYFSYVKIFIFTLIILSGFVGGFNWLINPFGQYSPNISLKRINVQKTQMAVGGGRIFKASALLNTNYRVVILGTSRANVGINPLHPKLEQMGGAYNAGLNGSNLYEIEKIFNFVLKNNKNTKLVIFSLDFIMFSNRRKTNADFEQSLFAGNHHWLTQLAHTFSLDEAYYSFLTLKDNFGRKRSIYDAMYTDRGATKQTFDAPHHTLFKNILAKNFLVNTNTYAGFCYSQDRLMRFKRILQTAREQEVDLVFFISPIHAWLLETIHLMGLYPAFEQWKRDLVNLIAENANLNPTQKSFPLWDFTGYNQFTTETIPDNLDQAMQWYWEASHYQHSLGNLVLTNILDKKATQDFGALLTPKNIEVHLQNTQQARQAYRQTHVSRMAELQQLVTHHMKKSHLPCVE